LQWIFEAKKRFRVTLLNYSVTSNHVHLLMKDAKGSDAIPRTMQLVAGRTGQEYNRRKNRGGAFWEDRYHATAVEEGVHLSQCMVYVDLNMVRAGVVVHPSEWPFCGYNEIQNPRKRYSLIDYGSLMGLFGIRSGDEFRKVYHGWVTEALERGNYGEREERWTESIAVGSESFAREVKEKLGPKAMWREMAGKNGSYDLREPIAAYETGFDAQNGRLRQKNTFFWDISV
jgi:REP element-mobilizing transposase RayT